MPSSQPSPPPPSQTSIDLNTEELFTHGLPADVTTEQTREFFRYCYALYFEQESWLDETLGECFQEDFEKFALQDFKDIDALQRRNMRTLLRYRNVYVPTGNKIRVANALYSLFTELKPWPEDQPHVPLHFPRPSTPHVMPQAH